MSVFRFYVYSRRVFVAAALADIVLFCFSFVLAAVVLLCALLVSMFILLRCPDCGCLMDLRGGASAHHFCPGCGCSFDETRWRPCWHRRQK